MARDTDIACTIDSAGNFPADSVRGDYDAKPTAMEESCGDLHLRRIAGNCGGSLPDVESWRAHSQSC